MVAAGVPQRSAITANPSNSYSYGSAGTSTSSAAAQESVVCVSLPLVANVAIQLYVHDAPLLNNYLTRFSRSGQIEYFSCLHQPQASGAHAMGG